MSALIMTVKNLYDQLDQSLRLIPAAQEKSAPSDISEKEQTPKSELNTPGEPKIDLEADFHDVACPLNYVKIKLLL